MDGTPKATTITALVTKLETFRKMWEGKDGKDLVKTNISLGLVLQDLIEMMEITEAQRLQILGNKLSDRIEEALG